MSAPLGPSVDEVLLMEEKHYGCHRLKPIGAERKIGRSHCKPTPFYTSEGPGFPVEISDAFDTERYLNSFEMSPSNLLSTPVASVQSDSLSYPRFYSQSSSSASSTSEHSPRSREHAAAVGWRTNASMRSSSRLSQTYPRVPFFTGYPSARSCSPFTTVPVFTAPFSSPRERFQVNSMGRPIVRPQNYHSFQTPHGYSIRR